jgi:HEAT repeat protein
MDADQALPVLKQVLAKRGPCTTELRKKAVFLVGQHDTPEAANMLVDVIRNDPEKDVKESAVFWLSQTRDDRAVGILDSILRTSDDADIRDKALFAISQFEGPKARAALRGYADRTDLNEETRAKAIFWLGQSRTDQSDIAFLKGLYQKVQSERLRDAIIQAVSESKNGGGVEWLLGLATDDKMPLESRKKALFWAGENGASITDLTGLYARLTDRDIREQLVFVLSQRNESAATDKLIDIAKNDPDRELRKKAIFWLGQKNDPRVKDLLLDIINKP